MDGGEAAQWREALRGAAGIEPEPPSIRVEQVELEAVHVSQVYLPQWRALTDASLWRQGWV